MNLRAEQDKKKNLDMKEEDKDMEVKTFFSLGKKSGSRLPLRSILIKGINPT